MGDTRIVSFATGEKKRDKRHHEADGAEFWILLISGKQRILETFADFGPLSSYSDSEPVDLGNTNQEFKVNGGQTDGSKPNGRSDSRWASYQYRRISSAFVGCSLFRPLLFWSHRL